MTGFGYNINTLGAYPNRDVSIDASGGTVTTSGDYTIHSFTSSGTFTVNSAPADATVEYLVIAGGGSGSHNTTEGGGGAGGYRTATGLAISAQAYSITIGAGGA